jgi:hypothetical protein
MITNKYAEITRPQIIKQKPETDRKTHGQKLENINPVCSRADWFKSSVEEAAAYLLCGGNTLQNWSVGGRVRRVIRRSLARINSSLPASIRACAPA